MAEGDHIIVGYRIHYVLADEPDLELSEVVTADSLTTAAHMAASKITFTGTSDEMLFISRGEDTVITLPKRNVLYCRTTPEYAMESDGRGGLRRVREGVPYELQPEPEALSEPEAAKT